MCSGIDMHTHVAAHPSRPIPIAKVKTAQAVFLLECRQTDREKKQTDSNERPTNTGGCTASVGKDMS